MKFSLWCILFFTMILSFICLGAKAAQAMSCDTKYSTVRDRLYGGRFNVIFVGTVTETQEDKMTFRIDEALKGLTAQEVKNGYLTFNIQKKDVLDIGERRLLFLNRSGTNHINYYPSSLTCDYTYKQRLPQDNLLLAERAERPLPQELLKEIYGSDSTSVELYFLGEVLDMKKTVWGYPAIYRRRHNSATDNYVEMKIKIHDIHQINISNYIMINSKNGDIVKVLAPADCSDIIKRGQKIFIQAKTYRVNSKLNRQTESIWQNFLYEFYDMIGYKLPEVGAGLYFLCDDVRRSLNIVEMIRQVESDKFRKGFPVLRVYKSTIMWLFSGIIGYFLLLGVCMYKRRRHIAVMGK